MQLVSKGRALLAAGALCLSSAAAIAQTTYTCALTGAAEVPAVVTSATGSATVVLNAAQTELLVSVQYQTLTGTYTASHIHGPAPVGTNAPVKWGFVGVPAGWVFTNGTHDGTLTNFLVTGLTATDVNNLNNGLMYVNVHSNTSPGGEIRGWLNATTVSAESKTWSQVKAMMR